MSGNQPIGRLAVKAVVSGIMPTGRSVVRAEVLRPSEVGRARTSRWLALGYLTQGRDLGLWRGNFLEIR
jgi:hypothetical protein